ncbi:10942_t:CDS:1, partial [Cetraspora pellucida]
MIRRNPTRLEIRQENVEQLQLLRQEYKKKLSQKPGASAKGKRKSMEIEEEVEPSLNFQQTEHQEQEPIVGAEELQNRRKN